MDWLVRLLPLGKCCHHPDDDDDTNGAYSNPSLVFCRPVLFLHAREYDLHRTLKALRESKSHGQGLLQIPSRQS
jgi:hypothetical protein